MPAITAAQRRLHRAALQLFAEKGVTRANVSELAEAAGVARGTIYNNLSDPDGLFAEVAGELAAEMSERIASDSVQVEDPAQRLANGIRYFARRTHEDPPWGRFLCRFALSTQSLREVWSEQPLADVLEGLNKGRFQFQSEQLPSVVAFISGTVLGSMWLVLEGIRTWRESGSEAAQFVLTALGVPPDEAQALARAELPALPDRGP